MYLNIFLTKYRKFLVLNVHIFLKIFLSLCFKLLISSINSDETVLIFIKNLDISSFENIFLVTMDFKKETAIKPCRAKIANGFVPYFLHALIIFIKSLKSSLNLYFSCNCSR